MKRKILDYVLAFLTLFCSWLFWQAVNQAMTNPDASTWIVPIIWFSLFAVLFFLDLIIIKIRYLVFIILLGSFLGELFFFPIFNIISFLMGLLVVWRVKMELAYGIRINLRRIIRSGALIFICAWSFAIASHYYFASQKNKMASPIPEFKMEGTTKVIVYKVLAKINPAFQKIEEENLTVDQFIVQGQSQSAIEVPELLEEMKQELVIEESRKKLSEISGFNLSGEEKVADVISQIINKKIIDIMPVSRERDGKFSPIFLIIASGLFFSLIALGSILIYLWTILVCIIFFFLRKADLVRLAYITFEREILD
ncbi:hypothetical protein KJ761_00345 [Patescibacteria group bacterium]|nr:hypothetical protein [Patescibacteria group bacterium]